MDMPILNVRLHSISDLKKSPRKIVDQVQDGKPTYILTNSTPQAVIIDAATFDKMVRKLRAYETMADNQKVAERVERYETGKTKLVNYEELTGHKLDESLYDPSDDGWE